MYASGEIGAEEVRNPLSSSLFFSQLRSYYRYFTTHRKTLLLTLLGWMGTYTAFTLAEKVCITIQSRAHQVKRHTDQYDLPLKSPKDSFVPRDKT